MYWIFLHCSVLSLPFFFFFNSNLIQSSTLTMLKSLKLRAKNLIVSVFPWCQHLPARSCPTQRPANGPLRVNVLFTGLAMCNAMGEICAFAQLRKEPKRDRKPININILIKIDFDYEEKMHDMSWEKKTQENTFNGGQRWPFWYREFSADS